MPNVTGTTRAQTTFLRAFKTRPAGPPPEQWPSASLLRKWLRRRAFRVALRSLRDTHRFQTDFHLAAAASAAALKLAASQNSALAPDDLKSIAQLLRLAHLRERFPTHYKLQSPSRPGLYTDADRRNLDPWNSKDDRWITPHPRRRRRRRKPANPDAFIAPTPLQPRDPVSGRPACGERGRTEGAPPSEHTPMTSRPPTAPDSFHETQCPSIQPPVGTRPGETQ
jgi:hypothetical protein